MGGHRRRISLPGVKTHKLINLVLMEDLDTQSAHLRPLRPPHLNLLAAAAIFHLNDAETDATGISEGLSGPHRFLFSVFFFLSHSSTGKHILRSSERCRQTPPSVSASTLAALFVYVASVHKTAAVFILLVRLLGVATLFYFSHVSLFCHTTEDKRFPMTPPPHPPVRCCCCIVLFLMIPLSF